MTKWKAEVIADNSGVFCGNGLTFDTKRDAENYARDLMFRWTAVRQWRVKRVPREPLTVFAEINLTGGITYYKVKVTRESIGAACSRLAKAYRGAYTDILVRDCLRYLTKQDTFYSRIRNGNL